MYGYTNWNAGVSADVLYMGNGTESAINWQISVAFVSTLATAGATSLIITDASKFPATGIIVIKEANTAEIYTTYSAKTVNTLTVPALAANVGAGACVTFQIMPVSTIPKGKIFTKYQGRLIVANQAGGESSVFASKVVEATNFTYGTAADDPYTQVITDGTGGISGIDNFGEYLVIEKEDSIHKMLTTTALDSSGASYKKIEVQPVATDVSMGPIQPWARIKKNNLLYYATNTEGILAINPDITGSQMSIQTSILSQPIQPLVFSLNMDDTRTTAFNQKILWSAATGAVSDTILAYDLNRLIWTRFNNWPVRDWLRHDKKLYFVSRVDNNVYQCFTDSNIDGYTPYETYAVTKRFDFGQSSMPKTMNKVFATGYISNNETLYFDAILVTGNQIITIPYKLDGNGDYSVTSIPMALAMAMMGVPTFGNVSIDPVNDLLGIFRIYLAIPNKFGFYTIQLKFYSSVQGTDWGVTGIGFSPIAEVRAPEQLTIGAIGDSYENSNSGILTQENEAFINLE
jgi:hypothetical protein